MTASPPPLRLLHTSDWHLGQELHGLSREGEHRAFLEWLLATLDTEQVDALLITGDVFDSQNPPVAAQALFYEFLARAKRARPDLDVVVIGGNHDSAARLEAPNALLRPLDVHVVGSLPKEPERLLVPLTDRSGRLRAVVAAIPFLRLADLPVPTPGEDVEDTLVWGVRTVHERVFAAARARCAEFGGLPLIATGHCYMVGTALSELSERRILGGNQHALPVDLFPADCTYVALGHLHKPQAVGGRETVRYAGSPFPLSVTEKDYPHQAVLVEISAEGPAAVRALPIPRTVDYLRVPRTGAAAPEPVLAELRALDVAEAPARDLRPYLEVVVRLDRPSPSLRHEVEQALEGKPVRLCRLAVEYATPEAGGPAAAETPDLAGLHPEEVFERAWARLYPDEPPEETHLAAFRELLESLDGDAPAASAPATEPVA
ncbi:exonuclease SbcCD subunit D C-terminal domain-containing protein [Caenispirillum bisanense]|uniref:Nuclease SbcCD subunit D n=1 Tax=Caenispirillum bisanense TaxID=414052 RepID=A0A286G5E4_9PROT|nr:exonuclease SbcCD subunit D C-terminal domain-containing protein [Caenispirillum bisanense]SOD90718.1 Exodeoxyribonuclease I subunit D [Caenispirillum bisanense]